MYRFTLDGQGDQAALITERGPRQQTWNGFAVPIATGDEIRAWVARTVANDPHTILTGQVVEDADAIFIGRQDDPDGERWTALPNYGAEGPRLYALDGLVWMDERTGDSVEYAEED